MSQLLRVDARASREIQAILFGMRRAEPEINRSIRRYTKEAIVPEFQRSMAEHADPRLEHRALVRNAKATVSNQNIKLTAGRTGRALSGGLLPKRDAHAVEFGGDRAAKRTYEARSRKGNRFSVTRRTRAQLRPRRDRGWVFHPTAAAMIPRILSLWTQIVVREFNEALEGKRG